MKSFGIRTCSGLLAFLSLVLLTSESRAAGPASAQQSVTQVQSALTDASLGWHRRCCGYGYRGWGGYGGWGYGGYAGYGYGGYGYAGYGYARPMLYSYPSYGYARIRYRGPVYYSGYSYASPYQSSYCCGYSSYSPSVYSVSSLSYPSQPVVYSSPVYSTPYSTPAVYTNPITYTTPTYSSTNYTVPATYSAPATYSVPSYNYGSPVYSPTYSPTPIVSPSSSTIYSTPAAAPYPAPPVEYTQPSVYQAPVATTPLTTVSNEYETYVPARLQAVQPAIGVPVYSTPVAYSGATHANYVPTTYNSYSVVSPLATRINYGLTW